MVDASVGTHRQDDMQIGTAAAPAGPWMLRMSRHFASQQPSRSRPWRPLAPVLGLVLLCACTSWKHGSRWADGGAAPLVDLPRANLVTEIESELATGGQFDALQEARRRFDQAEHHAFKKSPQCVDDFYAAAMLSWAAYVRACQTSNDPWADRVSAFQLYQESTARLIHEAQLHGRLNPRAGLVVHDQGERRIVPVEFHGFNWQPDDFQQWVVVGEYKHRSITNNQQTTGVGVPLVIVRKKPPGVEHETDFLLPVAVFSATAVLKPDGSALTLYDPLRTVRVDMAGEPTALARDLTASVAYGLHFHEQSRLEGFLRPNRAEEKARLILFEPYQPDKIPVVFVHGLLSNPQTWADILNDLRASPDLVEHFQFWAFRYSTGAPFVQSTSDLRRQLDEVMTRFDPDGTNPLLRRTVLVGHSMGGLISKLTISHSGEDVWNAIANLPLEQVATTEATRARLAERLYFDPHPMVERVVFIATPHQGSAFAGRTIGRVASALVVQQDAAYEQLTRDNIGGFKPAITRRMPTSIDLLDPDQPFLDIVWRLRVSDRVTLHSIIGDSCVPLIRGNSDGVVEVDSAKHPRVASELHVPASHSGILRHHDTIVELKRILRLHMACEDAELAPIEATPARATETRATETQGTTARPNQARPTREFPSMFDNPGRK